MNPKSEQELNKSLFVVCPFCQMEEFIKTKFGKNIFFLTFPGAVFNHKSEEELYLKDIITNERITDVYIVNDVSCRFIDEAINDKNVFGLNCERQFRKLIENFSGEFKTLPSKDKKESLAKANVLEQLSYLRTLKFLNEEKNDIKINFHGLISERDKGFEII